MSALLFLIFRLYIYIYCNICERHQSQRTQHFFQQCYNCKEIKGKHQHKPGDHKLHQCIMTPKMRSAHLVKIMYLLACSIISIITPAFFPQVDNNSCFQYNSHNGFGGQGVHGIYWHRDGSNCISQIMCFNVNKWLLAPAKIPQLCLWVLDFLCMPQIEYTPFGYFMVLEPQVISNQV